MISLSVYDPRPMEPDWVRFDQGEQPGPLDWHVRQRQWNRAIKKYEWLENCGSTIEELFAVLDYLMINQIEAEVTVDATDMGEPEKIPSIKTCLFYKAKVEDFTGLHHVMTASDCVDDTTSNDEALFFVEQAIYNREKIMLEINQYDPTPSYMEIGTMF